MRRCTTPGCDRRYSARGLCAPCYAAWYQKEHAETYRERQRARRLRHSVPQPGQPRWLRALADDIDEAPQEAS